MSKTIITAALLYANGDVHIGHLAGCYIPADTYYRYLKSLNKDVIFITGTDEHGAAITIKAKKENTTPKEIIDKYHNNIMNTFQNFGIISDIYSRTSNPVHHQLSQDFFTKLYNENKLVHIETEEYFDETQCTFLSDRYIVGTCPHCSNENAYGDQCEKCGSTLSPNELINPHSILSGNPPIKKSTINYYLPLDRSQTKLEDFINSKNWKNNVIGQSKSWLKQGLKPRAITRDLDWGVKVPLDYDSKVLYVWFDAPIGYISMTKELFEKYDDIDYQNKYNIKIRKQIKNKSYKDYWCDESTELIHFIGKDNIVFHTLIFPTMLMEHGTYILPSNVPANEFLNLEGNKISTSRNHAVWVDDFMRDFPNQQDSLRYYLTTNSPENKDANFTWKDFQQANNSELCGILGNFVNRNLILSKKYFDGNINVYPNDLKKELDDIEYSIHGYLEKFQFKNALDSFMNIARLGNKYITDNEPWKSIKTNSKDTERILYICSEINLILLKWMKIFLPFSAEKLENIIKSGNIELLFEKIEDEKITTQQNKLK